MRIERPNICLGDFAVDLVLEYGEAFTSKTGIEKVFKSSTTALDLAHRSALGLDQDVVRGIDHLIYVTQSTSHQLPSDVYRLHQLLKLPHTVSCTQISQGCSGFLQALLVANGYFKTLSGSRALIITADTYTHKSKQGERSVDAIFSDGASATIVKNGVDFEFIGVEQHSDGGGADFLVERSEIHEAPGLYMDGQKVFQFTRQVVVDQIGSILRSANVSVDDLGAVYLHQASMVVIDEIIRRASIPKELVATNLKQQGNITSSTIPSLISSEWDTFMKHKYSLFCGFGVGLSAITILLERATK